MAKIPNRYHFVFGLKPQAEPFHLVHYLCLRSCLEVNQPESLHFYCHYEPHGEWWERIRGDITVEPVELEKFVINHGAYGKHLEGQFIKRHLLDYAHQADFLRLKVLIASGGVYADMDTLFVHPLPAELFQKACVIGEEDPVPRVPAGQPERSLCNAHIMAEADSQFCCQWLDEMYKAFDGTWNAHSCRTAAKLMERGSGDIFVAPSRYFYKHMWTPAGLHTLLEGFDPDFEDVYSMHLWSHLWWDRSRTDFSLFHGGMLTDDYIRRVDTTYNIVGRRFLPGA